MNIKELEEIKHIIGCLMGCVEGDSELVAEKELLLEKAQTITEKLQALTEL